MSGRKVLYKTATFAEEEGYSVMERHLKEGRDVLFLSLSSALSGTYQLGILIAKELTEKYPERKIICVDSLRYSTAFAMLVMLACQKRDSGADIDECAQYVNAVSYTHLCPSGARKGMRGMDVHYPCKAPVGSAVHYGYAHKAGAVCRLRP